MADLGVSQATATAHFDRWLQADRKALQLQDLVNLFTTSKAYVRQDGGYTTAGARMLTEFDLSGIKLGDNGRNTDADGRLWVRITANGGNWDVALYKAKTAQAADKVAEFTNVAAGATGTFAAANSSGITGTAKLGSSVAAIAADTYSIQVFLGWAEYDRQVFAGTQQEDGELLAVHSARNVAIGRAIAGLVSGLNRLNEGPEHLKQMARIWQVPPDIGFLDKRVENNDDVISTLINGAFELMRINWNDNTTVQKVPVTTLAAGARSYANPSGGVVVATPGTVGPNLEPGLVQAVVVEDELPNQRYRVTFTPSDGTGPIIGRGLLTVGKVWDDPDLPVQLTVVNTYAKTGDGSNLHLAAASSFSFVNPTRDNTDDGLLYWKVVSSGSNWIIEFYSDSNRTKKVAQSPATAASGAFSATQQNRSGLTVSGTVGSAPVNGTTGTIDMQPVKKGNSTTAADQFYFSITRSAKGKIQEATREFHGWKLNQGSSPTFADTFIEKGSAFIDGNP